MVEVEHLDDIAASLDAFAVEPPGDPSIRAQRMLQHYARRSRWEHRC